MPQAQFRQICTVPDSNIWLKTGLLGTSIGAALTYYTGLVRGIIGLPEIVEREILKNSIRLAREANVKVIAAFESLKRIGYADQHDWPDDAVVADLVDSRLKQLSPYLVRTPFTFAHAQQALDRVIDELPPNKAGNQQFKDSAIWEAVLELSDQYAVRFITTDKGFFNDGDPRKGTAATLVQDVEARSRDIVIYPSLEDFLAALQRQVQIPNHQAVIEMLADAVHPQLEQQSQENGFTLGGVANSRLMAFPTDRENVLAVTFDLSYTAEKAGAEGEPVKAAVVSATGSCSLLVQQESFSSEDIALNSIWFETAGSRNAGIIFAPASEAK